MIDSENLIKLLKNECLETVKHLLKVLEGCKKIEMINMRVDLHDASQDPEAVSTRHVLLLTERFLAFDWKEDITRRYRKDSSLFQDSEKNETDKVLQEVFSKRLEIAQLLLKLLEGSGRIEIVGMVNNLPMLRATKDPKAILFTRWLSSGAIQQASPSQ